MTSRNGIRANIIELLAEKKRCEPAELERQLKEKGAEMPIDSHRLVRIVPKLGRQLGVKIKFDRQLAPHLKSVETLVAYVFELAQKAAAA
jgi:acyl carrier protein